MESLLMTLSAALVKVQIQMPTRFVTPQAFPSGESTIGTSVTLQVVPERRYKSNGTLVGRG